MACMEKLKVMNSQIGRSLWKAAPIAMPAKPASVIGVSITRLSPYFSQRPFVILYAPWYCATSSPRMKTSPSRAISSSIAELSASRTVIVVLLESARRLSPSRPAARSAPRMPTSASMGLARITTF